jgi:uncharacterized membrane protein
MRFDHEATINAPASMVWDIYSDVEHWPDWTASIKTVKYVEGTGLELGNKAEIEQPKLPRATWTVTALTPGASWIWESRAPGVHTTAVHELEVVDANTTKVHTAIVQEGFLGAIVGRIWAKLTRTYLTMEADGLKSRSEARASA